MSSKETRQILAVATISLFSLVQPAHSQLNSYGYRQPYGYNPSPSNVVTGQLQGPANAVTSCNDLQCAVDECCIETHRSPFCVNLVYAYGQAYCPRLKKCSSNIQCPEYTCCVQAIDPTMTTTCKNPQATNAGAGGYTGYPMPKAAPESEGYCQRAAATGELCFLPVPGAEASNCPCSGANDECKPLLQPFTAGVCKTK